MNKNNQKVCVIGLGYVGFPLAVLCAQKGYEVFGFDKDEKKLSRIEKGENVVEEKYLEEIIPKVKINVIRDEKEIKNCDSMPIGMCPFH